MKPLITSLALCLVTPAIGHVVRIEPTTEQQLVVVFGEPGEPNETSPGRLDPLTLPIAWTDGPDGPVPLVVTKQSSRFLLTGVSADQATLAETRYPAFKRGSRPASWPQFYQRWHPATAAAPDGPALTFDILPAQEADRFRVYFRGEPLGGVEVGVDHLGNGYGANLVSDENGYVTYRTDQPGLILMTANHKENLPGFTRGKPYRVTSHNTALTWVQP